MQKWVHIIGICGVTTSGLAVSFKNNGWKVTGSDKGFFAPVSDYLISNGIKILPGFKKERLSIDQTHPDLVIFQGTKGRFNVELIEAKELKLKIQSYPEVLEEMLINKNQSIVISGSYGKTTTTALLVNIIKKSKLKINYMYGGLNSDFSPNIEFKPDSDLSVVEGDEYITSYQDMTSKFFHYKPTTLLIMGAVWDHADVFKNENQYIENFKKFVSTIPEDGLLIVNSNDNNCIEISKSTKSKIIYFSPDLEKSLIKPDWYLLTDTKPFPCVIKTVKGNSDLEIIPFERNMIGKINEQNILAAIVLARTLDLDKTIIQRGIKEFKGIKRRMEIRYKDSNVSIIDDFGSTPGKAKKALTSLREDFPNKRSIIIFEPSAGSRNIKSLSSYKNSFENSDIIFIPKFTRLGIDVNSDRFDEKELENILNKFNYLAKFVDNDEKLIENILEQIKIYKKGTVILFMGSHSFRKIIQNLIRALENGKK